MEQLLAIDAIGAVDASGAIEVVIFIVQDRSVFLGLRRHRARKVVSPEDGCRGILAIRQTRRNVVALGFGQFAAQTIVGPGGFVAVVIRKRTHLTIGEKRINNGNLAIAPGLGGIGGAWSPKRLLCWRRCECHRHRRWRS